MTDLDPRQEYLRQLAAELRCRPMARRRVLKEMAHHVDDAVADLRARGLPEGAALDQALHRLGEPASIAGAFARSSSGSGWRGRTRTLRSPAWIAVAVMSVVTVAAAELPLASGAEARSAPHGHAAHIDPHPTRHRTVVPRHRAVR